MLPAFYHFYEWQDEKKQVGYMKPHPKLAAVVKKFFCKDEVGDIVVASNSCTFGSGIVLYIYLLIML